MICNKCNSEIPEGEQIKHRGQIICEDCYVEMIDPPRSCDVSAVHSAKMSRKMAGQEGTEGLTEIQKNVYNFIKAEGPVTGEQIMSQFSLSKLQFDKTFAVLRHCELAHGFRENGRILFKIWGQDTLGKMDIDGE